MIQTQELANQTSSKLMIHASKAEVELKMKQKGLNNLRTSARSFEETLEGSEGNEKLDQRVFQEVFQECKSTLDHSMNHLKKYDCSRVHMPLRSGIWTREQSYFFKWFIEWSKVDLHSWNTSWNTLWSSFSLPSDPSKVSSKLRADVLRLFSPFCFILSSTSALLAWIMSFELVWFASSWVWIISLASFKRTLPSSKLVFVLLLASKCSSIKFSVCVVCRHGICQKFYTGGFSG